MSEHPRSWRWNSTFTAPEFRPLCQARRKTIRRAIDAAAGGVRFTLVKHAGTLRIVCAASRALDQGAAEPRPLERQKARFGSGPRDAGRNRETSRCDNLSFPGDAKKRKPALRWESAPWRQLPRTSGTTGDRRLMSRRMPVSRQGRAA